MFATAVVALVVVVLTVLLLGFFVVCNTVTQFILMVFWILSCMIGTISNFTFIILYGLN